MSAAGSTSPHVKALICPNCGGGVELRGMGQALNVVCIQCLTILDARTPSLEVIQQFQSRERILPLIPLGSRGKLHGTAYEVIGFQVREIYVELIPYQWREYVLFNPYKGFRYLSEYDGHWSDIKPLKGLPESATWRGRPAARWLGSTYGHFQSATATTVYVMGEFPWQVRVGEQARVSDYVSPPRMLSSEETAGEITWSLGEYRTGDDIWKTFQLPGAPPPARGVYANQPSPMAGKVHSSWVMCLKLMAMLFLVLVACVLLMGHKTVFSQDYGYTPGVPGEASFVTPVFELGGRPSNVQISVRTDLDNQWMYFNFALINETTGQAWDFGREVSYYHGRDSDGNWTEGGRNDSATLGSIPAGRYYLRVEPEYAVPGSSGFVRRPVHYRLIVQRDVPNYWIFLVGFLLLLIPPILATIRGSQFESRRWAESDHAPSQGDDDDE